MKIKRSVFLLIIVLTTISQLAIAQKQLKGIDFDFMLKEFYGEQEFERKSACCAQQIERNKYFLQKSYYLSKEMNSEKLLQGSIGKVLFSPKVKSQITVAATELVALIKKNEFNILISDISVNKNMDQLFKLEGTELYLYVLSESNRAKSFIRTLK
jgi:hypothetical protein